jgi:hypothetical protein
MVKAERGGVILYFNRSGPTGGTVLQSCTGLKITARGQFFPREPHYAPLARPVPCRPDLSEGLSLPYLGVWKEINKPPEHDLSHTSRAIRPKTSALTPTSIL